METPRSKAGPNKRQGVRVVGKIRPFLDSDGRKGLEGESSSSSSPSSTPSTNCTQILMSRTEAEFASISFGDQANSKKDGFKLDWCYGEDEGVLEVFNKEVKPLLQGILKGSNGCVIAYGAQGSGKTRLIQGSEEEPGLALMAISEILPAIEEIGGSVNISCYEVCQERVYDLLAPKEQEVLVMEDGSRRIQLKGLSQVPVKSISDFKNYYFRASSERRPSQNLANEVCNERKPIQKVANEVCKQRKTSQKVTTGVWNEKKSLENVANDVAIRNHRGLIIYVSYTGNESRNIRYGKMNFVDLAGYEDTKRKTFAKETLAEITKVNKSLYALLNVICALNSGETYVPFRETKLTHLLQDFICRPSHVVMFTCLNPTPCQDTVHAVSLASRSSQVVNKLRHDSSAKNNKNGQRSVLLSSSISGGIGALSASVKKLEISLGSVEMKGSGSSSMTNKSQSQTVNNLLKKPGTCLYGRTAKKLNAPSHSTKGRMVLKSESPSIKSRKDNSITAEKLKTSDIESSTLEVDTLPVNELTDLKEETGIGLVTDLKFSSDPNVATLDNKRKSLSSEICGPSPIVAEKLEEINAVIVNEGRQSPATDVSGPSPTLTDKLREISNSLKLASSKPINLSTPQNLCKKEVTMDSVEPITPKAPVCLHIDGDSRFEDKGTPHSVLKARSTGLKKSLVQECLSFLNSASKEELKDLKGIGEKRAAFIIELREETPEPFKDMEDIKSLGLSSKQIKGMMSQLLDF